MSFHLDIDKLTNQEWAQECLLAWKANQDLDAGRALKALVGTKLVTLEEIHLS